MVCMTDNKLIICYSTVLRVLWFSQNMYEKVLPFMNLYKTSAKHILPPVLIFIDCIFPKRCDVYVFRVILSTH